MALTPAQQKLKDDEAIAAQKLTEFNAAEQAVAQDIADATTEPVVIIDPPVITNFTATPSTITAGDAIMLAWDVTGADTVSLDQGIGALGANGTRSVSPGTAERYTLTATNGGGTVQATVDVLVNAVVVVPPLTGLPSALTFVPFATDPAAATNFGSGGGARGYGCMRALPNGKLVLFGASDGHDSHAYNGIDIIGVNGVRNIRPHTTIKLGPASAETNNLLDGRNIANMMGRDNQTCVVTHNNIMFVFDGEREPGVFGNYGGAVDLSAAIPVSWLITDVFGVMPLIDGTALKLEDGASARIDALDICVLFGGYNDVTDWLQIIAPNPVGSTHPYRFITFANPDLASQFPGSRHLRYVSSQNFQHGTQLRVYGGKGGDTPTSHYDLYAVECSDINNPHGVLLSTNTLPAEQRVQGEAIIAMEYPDLGGVMTTNGVLANWFSYRGNDWHVLPVTNPAPFRVSPEEGGSGAMAAYSTALGTGVVLWANTAMIELMQLTVGSAPPVVVTDPPPVVDPLPPPSGVNAVSTVTSGGVVIGASKTSVKDIFLYFDGTEVQGAAEVQPRGDGAWVYQLPQSFFDGQEHTVYGRADADYLDNAPRSAPFTFRLPNGGIPTGPFVPMPPADTGSSGTPTPEQPGTGGSGSTPQPTPTDLIPLPGSRVITTTAHLMPAEIAEALHGKHYDPVKAGAEWLWAFGDHKSVAAGEPLKTDGNLNLPEADSGNQQQFRWNLLTKIARKTKNYFLRAPTGVNPDSLMEGAVPDDGGCCVRGNELFVFTSERVDQAPTRNTVVDGVTVEGCTERSRRLYGPDIVVQEMDAITAMDLATGAWRNVLSPRPHCIRGDRLWRVSYDPTNDFFFSIVNNGGDFSFFRMKGTGEDITNYNPGTNVPAKLNWDSTGLGEITAHVAGMAIDWVARMVYFYDHYTTRIYSISVDGVFSGNEIPKVLAELSSLGEPKVTDDQPTIKCSWDPLIKAFVLNGITGKFVYEPPVHKCTFAPHADGFTGGDGSHVPMQTFFWADELEAHVSAGSIDWTDLPGVAPVVTGNYFTTTIQ